jgi:ataxin-3
MFTAVDLAQLASELDELERQVLIEGADGRTDGAELLSFLAQDSSNVAEDGNYSIQVLQRALQPFQLELERASPREAASLDRCTAFIANQGEHWLCQRRIGNDWWNLNSLLDAPQFLSRFYVEAYLASLVDQGYDLFVVRGELPPPNDTLDGVGQWFTAVHDAPGDVPKLFDADGSPVTAAASTTASQAAEKNKKKGGSAKPVASLAADDEDDDLRRAIEASLADADAGKSTQPPSRKRLARADADDRADGDDDDEGDDDDDEMKMAIAMSLK